MASTDVRSVVLTLAVVVLLAAMVYTVDPTMFGLIPQMDGFQDSILPSGTSNGQMPSTTDVNGADQATTVMGDENSAGGDSTSNKKKEMMAGFKDVSGEGFADLQDVTGPAAFGDAAAPAGCYPRDQLTPGELLPQDANSVWAQQNPMGNGSLKGKNFLSAGALVGVNTVGQTLRNANWQLRSEPANPQVAVSVFNQSTIAPDTNRRDLEIA
jgi:hypothetical protein